METKLNQKRILGEWRQLVEEISVFTTMSQVSLGMLFALQRSDLLCNIQLEKQMTE